jgi:chromosome segregation ATPase
VESEAILLSNTLSRARQAQSELDNATIAHRAVQTAREAAAAAAATAEKALLDATTRLQAAERDEAAIRTRLTALRKEHDEALSGMKPLIEKAAMLEEQAKRAEEAAGRLTGIQQATKVAQKALADGETALAKLRPETAALEQRKAVMSQELEAAKTDLVEIQARLTVLREEHRKQSEEFRNQNEAYLELLKKRIEDGSGSPKGEAPKKDAPSLK